MNISTKHIFNDNKQIVLPQQLSVISPIVTKISQQKLVEKTDQTGSD
jgi:hypothetical protein